MSGKKLKKTFNSILVFVLALGIIVMINLFAQKHFSRVDLTEEKQYTLSDSSRNAVENLQDILTVTIYVTRNLPPRLEKMKDDIVDMLEEYQSYSDNRMRLKFIDPGDDEELKQELQQYGIQQMPWQVQDKDKIEVVNVYFGITVQFRDRIESIPVVNRPDSFEYTMTATILKTTAPEVKVIGFLKGHEEYDPYVELGQLGDLLEDQYRITLVNLEYAPQVPGHVNVLVIAKPEGDLPDYQLFAIDQFLMNGGSLVVLRDTIKLKQNQLAPDPISTNLDDLLSGYGITFGDELVLDRYNKQASFNMGRGMMMTTPYPFWVRIENKNMDSDNPAMTNINEVLLPWTTWLNLNVEEGMEVSRLLVSSEFSWTQPAYNLNPQQNFTPAPEKMMSRILAARLNGKFKSYFTGMEIPQKPQVEGERPSMPFPAESRLDESSEDAVIIVAGNARFITGEVLRMAPLNLNFMLNTIDQIAYGNDLIKLRSRGIKQRVIEEKLDDKMKSRLRAFNLFGMPFAVLLFAVLLAFYRRAKRSKA